MCLMEHFSVNPSLAVAVEGTGREVDSVWELARQIAFKKGILFGSSALFIRIIITLSVSDGKQVQDMKDLLKPRQHNG